MENRSHLQRHEEGVYFSREWLQVPVGWADLVCSMIPLPEKKNFAQAILVAVRVRGGINCRTWLLF